MSDSSSTSPAMPMPLSCIRNRFAAWAMLALLLTFNGPGADAQPASGGGNSATVITNAGAAVAASPVKVLNAGSGTRKALRLHPGVGDKQTMTMTMKMAMAMSLGGKSMPPGNIPAMVITMVAEVAGKAANGDISYKMTVQDATVVPDAHSMPGIAEAMKSSFAGIRGVSGEGRVSDHGVNLGSQMKLPATADPQTVQAMEQMKDALASSSYPIPDEAVGVGAKWEQTTQSKTQGMTIDQTTTYELASIDGDRLTLRISQTQSAGNQEIENPAAPGMKLDLVKMTGTGTGKTTFNLSHILPISGILDSDTETVMSMGMGQQKQTMDMKMKMNITTESK